MKWWICLTALVLALTTSAAAADLPAELERAAPEAAEDLTGGDLSGGTGFAQGVGNILDRLADQVGDVVRERTRGAAAVLLVVVLVYLIKKTKIGMAMRAASRDFETAQLMGIKINNIISFTFVIGSFLAAVGSALYFTNYPSIVPLSGSLPGLRAFVAAVFGGIGSIPGAVVGAFLIGLSETVIKSSNWSVFSDAFTFALLIIILVVKPTGLFGEKSTDKV